MNYLHSILIDGTLVDDPRRVPLSDPPDGVKLVKFDIASNRYYMDRNGEKAKETVFIGVQCWGSLGDKCMEKLRKGMQCRTVGRLRLCRWVSADGTTRRAIEIVSSHLEFRRPKHNGSGAPGLEILEDTENASDTTGEAEVFYSF